MEIQPWVVFLSQASTGVGTRVQVTLPPGYFFMVYIVDMKI
jgi:hypothetical protein